MPRGGKRKGAGRKPGSTTRPREELERERAFAAMKKAAAEEAKRAREAEAAARHAARQKRHDEREAVRAEKVKIEILPPMPGTGPPPGLGPLRFLESLMDNDNLPLGFRRDCAALALPFRAPKPVAGLKDLRNDPASWIDDDDDDGIARALRN